MFSYDPVEENFKSSYGNVAYTEKEKGDIMEERLKPQHIRFTGRFNTVGLFVAGRFSTVGLFEVIIEGKVQWIRFKDDIFSVFIFEDFTAGFFKICQLPRVEYEILKGMSMELEKNKERKISIEEHFQMQMFFKTFVRKLKEARIVMAVGGAVMAAYSIVNMILSSQNGAQFGSQVYTLAGGIVLIIVGLALAPIARYFVN